MAWSRKFSDPMPKGFETLEKAAAYIMKLPKAKQNLPHWQAATHALIAAAEDKGPMMHARIGILRALDHGTPRVLSDRKDQHWGKRKLKRDE